MSDSPNDTREPQDDFHNGHREIGRAGQAPQGRPPRATVQAPHADQDEWVAAYAADELNADERAIFARHLATCVSCQGALAQTRRIHMLLGSLAFAAPAADDRTDGDAQWASADDALAATTDHLPITHADQPESSTPSTSSKWASRPLSPTDRVSLPDARSGDADQGALTYERLRAIPPGANALHGRRGARGAMDPNTWQGAQPYTTRVDDPMNADDARQLTTRMGNAPSLPPMPPPRRRRPYLALATTLLLVALAAGVFGVLRLRHGGTETRVEPSPTVSHATPTPTGIPLDPHTGLPVGLNITAIQMLSATDGWGAGVFPVANGTDGVILHYAGGRWKVNHIFPGLSVNSIYMITDFEGWAVSGALTDPGPGAIGVILHDHHGGWTQSAPLANDDLTKVTMLSPTEGWIIGSDATSKAAAASVILHILNGAWTKVPTSLLAIADVSMVSATDGWLVGNDGTIGRYQNGAWSQWPQIATGSLNAVQMLSATDGWAVGLKSVTVAIGDVRTEAYVLHYDGASWQEVNEPIVINDGQLNAISMDSPTDGWAVGQFLGPNGPNSPGLTFHYTHGQWVNVPLSTSIDLNSISMVSATDGWAIGATGSLILHYAHGVWAPYQP